ncbi:tat (twin-arginine translocation) pathway signal sequence [Salinisphaera aquimarina]|uniref:Tat (Twin-arginine translocation) pathway signal sequence n=1 Tax=Salinisphaera aquimarina TaxID=2094031 RepID=A0ABV7EM33_9GAMM
MSDIALSRRRFLAASGSVLVGTLAASSGAIALLAPSRSWAVELKSLSTHQSKTLLQFIRYLYPHDTLDDAVYALVVKDLDDGAAAEPATRKRLVEGVAHLDDATDGNWLAADDDARFEQVKALEGTPFFENVRGTAVVSLYSNELAYAHFGYPGPRGDSGYLYRGFNDLDWLPDPADEASGPIPNAKRS